MDNRFPLTACDDPRGGPDHPPTAAREPGLGAANRSAAPPLPTESAFAELLPEISAVPEAELATINVDVVEVVTLVLGVLPQLRSLRPEIQKLPFFDLERFDRLEKYALALSHAHTRHRSTLPSKGNVAVLGKELAVLRDRLHTSAMSLADYGLLDGSVLKQCKRFIGYRATATDVFTLVALFKESWSEVAGKTPVTLEALNDAGQRAVGLLAAFGAREQGPASTAEAARLRQQAFTLFAAAYDDARRAVAYLRPAPGARDEIAPTFYASRGGPRRTAMAPSHSPPVDADGARDTTGSSSEVVMDLGAELPVADRFAN